MASARDAEGRRYAGVGQKRPMVVSLFFERERMLQLQTYVKHDFERDVLPANPSMNYDESKHSTS